MPNPRLDTLLMLSGGIDSVYCLWRRVQAGLPTRTHHVILSDREGRQTVERVATTRVLKWMRANGGQSLVEHTESKVDFKDMWVARNYWLWGYWAGVIFASPRGRNLTKVIRALPKEDIPGCGRGDFAYRSFIKSMSGRSPELVFPIADKPKAEMIREMPKELLDLCWFCRTPKDGQTCGTCITCRVVQPVLKSI